MHECIKNYGNVKIKNFLWDYFFTFRGYLSNLIPKLKINLNLITLKLVRMYSYV